MKIDKGVLERAQKELKGYEIADVVELLAMYRAMFAVAGSLHSWQSGVTCELVSLLADVDDPATRANILAETKSCVEEMRSRQGGSVQQDKTH